MTGAAGGDGLGQCGEIAGLAVRVHGKALVRGIEEPGTAHGRSRRGDHLVEPDMRGDERSKSEKTPAPHGGS
jgi:hypothetical protein